MPTDTNYKLEDYIPVVKYHGLNTDKAVDLDSTLNVEGASTLQSTLAVTGAITASGGTVAGLPNATVTDIDAQNGTPTAAECLGGVIVHTSVTGAGTLTVPTGANLSLLTGAIVGSKFTTLYENDGSQTVTVTTAASGTTLVGGTAAVTTGKHMVITFLCTAADTWNVYLQTLM